MIDRKQQPDGEKRSYVRRQSPELPRMNAQTSRKDIISHLPSFLFFSLKKTHAATMRAAVIIIANYFIPFLQPDGCSTVDVLC